MITQYGAMAGLKEQNQHPLGCMAEGNERYIESAAAHAAFVSLISAVVRGRLTCTKAGGWGLARFPCAQTSAGVIWKLRHGACPNDEQPATTPTPYQTPPPLPPLHHHTTTTALRKNHRSHHCTSARSPHRRPAWSRRPRPSPRAKVPRADEQSATGC